MSHSARCPTAPAGAQTFHADQQRERIEAACERDGLRLLRVLDERDVSGSTPLADRKGLLSAVRAVEAGEAQVIVAAYFDRLVRSLKVQGELIERVEAAGGQVLAVDVGRITNGSAGQWLTGTLLGAVNEYATRTARERSGEAQRRAVERGAAPFPNVPPGYRRGKDGRLKPHAREAPIVAQAFRLRSEGQTVQQVREFMQANGIKRSYHATCSLLASRVVLGEIRFGELVNEKAHEPIVGAETWRAVQRTRVPAPLRPRDGLHNQPARCPSGPTLVAWRFAPASGDEGERGSAELGSSRPGWRGPSRWRRGIAPGPRA
jgi:DNA invertase Pin-like site-specific DNA recombinase